MGYLKISPTFFPVWDLVSLTLGDRAECLLADTVADALDRSPVWEYEHFSNDLVRQLIDALKQRDFAAVRTLARSGLNNCVGQCRTQSMCGKFLAALRLTEPAEPRWKFLRVLGTLYLNGPNPAYTVRELYRYRQ